MNFTLPIKDSKQSIPACVLPALEPARRHWDATIQRVIDAQRPPLASLGWRWSQAAWRLALSQAVASASQSLFSVLQVGTAFRGYVSAAESLAQQLGQSPCVLALTAPAHGSFPLAMALVCDSFVEDEHFLWMLSGTPKSALAPVFGKDQPGRVGVAMVWALCRRALLGDRPRGLILHAAPEGGQALLDWYARELSMTIIPDGVRVSALRVSDGRYLRLSSADASALTIRLNREFGVP